MRARGGAWLSLSFVVAALEMGMGAACTKINPNYHKRQDGGTIDIHSDGSEEAGSEARADVGGGDVPPDAPVGCTDDNGCKNDPAGPVCDVANRKCVHCLLDKDCRPDGGSSVCDKTAHTCVGCLVNDNACPASTPVCEATTNACRSCKTDSECVAVGGADPGICASNGHCATNDEVVYAIQPTSSNCTTADGSLAMPYCKAQDAVTAARVGSKPFVVLRGSFGSISVNATGGRITVVGQGNAMVNPGGDLYGVDVSGTADLAVRNLTVTGGTSATGGAAHVNGAGATLTLVAVQMTGNTGAGVLAEGQSVLVMNRCVIKGGGGLAPAALKTTNSSFHVTNSVFASSSIGASLDSNVPGGGDRFFKNNTVVNNATGLVCTGLSLSGLISFGNTNDAIGCTPTSCCTGNPLLTSDYHLMSGSPCVDQLDFDPQVPDDLDGQTRPQGTKADDCGADELVAAPTATDAGGSQ